MSEPQITPITPITPFFLGSAPVEPPTASTAVPNTNPYRRKPPVQQFQFPPLPL